MGLKDACEGSLAAPAHVAPSQPGAAQGLQRVKSALGAAWPGASPAA